MVTGMKTVHHAPATDVCPRPATVAARWPPRLARFYASGRSIRGITPTDDGDAEVAMPGVQAPRRPMPNRVRAEPNDRHGEDLRPYLAADLR